MSTAGINLGVQSPPASHSPRPFSIAVVGCGPKGLYCLERLAQALTRRRHPGGVEITIFEPAPYPGAGLVYDPRQPSYLLMNYAVAKIDAWPTDPQQRPLNASSLNEWLSYNYPGLASGRAYVPRAVVGSYLNECFLSVVEVLKRHSRVRVIPEHVDQVLREGDRWSLTTFDRTPNGRLFDEVLLTVGHEGWRNSAANSDAGYRFDVEQVFPVRRRLSAAAVPAASRVAMRGMGLSAIDAVLALTVGRGGSFVEQGDRCSYQAGGGEPAVIYPYSRSGRPMLAKPTPGVTRVPKDLDDLWTNYRDQLNDLSHRDQRDFATCIWPVICEAAEQALARAGGSGVEDWYSQWTCDHQTGDAAYAAISESVEVALGRREPGAPWALGEAWRQLYPALVNLVSHRYFSNCSWEAFKATAAEMERIAFGPPVDNCQRLMALVDCGLVDLRFLNAGSVGRRGAGRVWIEIPRSLEHAPVDVHINAVLPRASQAALHGPLRAMARRGVLTPHESGNGFRITPAGRPINSTNKPCAGLALLGRPTEGCVLGNDTLSRTLHPHPQRWADDVVTRIVARDRIPA